MRVLLCDELVGEHPPEHWVGSALHTLRGTPLRFGLAEQADTAFDAGADHNREHVLLRVLGFSLNYRDTSLVLGEQPEALHDRTRGIGSDFVGEVLAVGSAVPGLAVGDRVVPTMDWPPRPADAVSAGVLTNHASRQLQRVHHTRLLPVPPDMPVAEAAAFSVSAQTAYAMLRRAEVTADSTVLVTAATSVTSLFAASAAAGRGARVWGLSRRGRGREVLAAQGIRRVFDPGDAAEVAELGALARELRGFDAVLDPFGDSYLLTAMKLLGFHGRYVTCRLMGGPGEQPDIGAVPAAEWLALLTSMVAKNAAIHGQCLGERADLAAALADHAAGRLRVVLDSVHRGADIASFVRRTFDTGRLGKAVYLFDEAGSEA